VNMERGSFVAIALCVLFYLGYTQYLSKKYPEYYTQQRPVATNLPQSTTSADQSAQSNQTGTTTSTTATTGTANAADSALQPATATITRLPDTDLEIETDTSRYRLSQDEGGIASVKLKSFNDKLGESSEPIELLDAPLVLQGSIRGDQTSGLRGVFNAERNGRTIKFWREDGPWTVTQTFTFPDTGYGIDVAVSFKNNAPTPTDLNASLLQVERLSFANVQSSWLPGMPAERPRVMIRAQDSNEFLDAENFCTDASQTGVNAPAAKIDFVGFDRHYFLSTLTPKLDKLNIATFRVGQTSKENCFVGFRVGQQMGLVGAGESVTLEFKGFFGPKITEVMALYNPTFHATLGHGWLDVIANPLMYAIKGFHQLTGNYGIAIILLTIALKVLFYPLTRAAAVSMHKMKKLNPEMTKLREKYKDDPQAQQRELMKFWQQHQINPMKGCLPILPQIPVFFAFYRVLSSSIELRHAPFFGWIHDLAAADPYFVTPVLLTAGMFLQQKLTPMTGMDKTQEKVLMMMPIVFGIMMLTLPSGMVIYMLTNTIVSIGQQQWLNRKLDAA